MLGGFGGLVLALLCKWVERKHTKKRRKVWSLGMLIVSFLVVCCRELVYGSFTQIKIDKVLQEP